VPLAGNCLVVKTDMLVGKTDVPPGMTHRQAARKAVAMCVSDFAAKGVRPDSFLVSLGLPRTIAKSHVEEMASGLEDASREWNVKLVGGDTGEANDLVINCTMVGFAERAVVGRSGARPGELVVTTGFFGYPPSGLKIMMEGAHARDGFRRKAVESVVRPRPNLAAGLALGRYLSSSMDSSDGLAICLHDIAHMSRVGMSLRRIPVRSEVRVFARSNGLSLDRLVFGGGEEYLSEGTVAEARFRSARRAAKASGADLVAIGRVTGKRGEVVLREEGGHVREIPRMGWTHLG